jgi:hypothetical protein
MTNFSISTNFFKEYHSKLRLSLIAHIYIEDDPASSCYAWCRNARLTLTSRCWMLDVKFTCNPMHIVSVKQIKIPSLAVASHIVHVRTHWVSDANLYIVQVHTHWRCTSPDMHITVGSKPPSLLDFEPTVAYQQ